MQEQEQARSLQPDAPDRHLDSDVLDDRYRLGRKLGSGAMGEVYEAYGIPGGQRVAVKLLKPRHRAQPVLIERFVREARSMALIDHPNVVKIRDFGRHDRASESGPVYFVMEYLEGEDLDSVLERQSRLPWSQCKPILLQLASALRAAHERGIVHRDIKPSNCMLVHKTGALQVKLLDFGIAKLDASLVGRELTKAADLLGTAHYMAPEQVEGAAIDARSDIYSFAAMAYELLTGQLPFREHDVFKIMAQQLRTPPRPPRELVAELPRALDELLLAALAKDPAARPQSMAEVEYRLRAIAVPGHARRPTKSPAPAPSRQSPSRPATMSWRPSPRTLPANADARAKQSSDTGGDTWARTLVLVEPRRPLRAELGEPAPARVGPTGTLVASAHDIRAGRSPARTPPSAMLAPLIVIAVLLSFVLGVVVGMALVSTIEG